VSVRVLVVDDSEDSARIGRGDLGDIVGADVVARLGEFEGFGDGGTVRHSLHEAAEYLGRVIHFIILCH
jgi:hypothetical protein